MVGHVSNRALTTSRACCLLPVGSLGLGIVTVVLYLLASGLSEEDAIALCFNHCSLSPPHVLQLLQQTLPQVTLRYAPLSLLSGLAISLYRTYISTT